jgi:4-diphosphocytidyl-2-C-methyl-D-erythritol kinase
MSTTRRVRVRALGKINLDLRVLGKRPDGYHEIRTILQTISLSDSLDMAFTPGRKTSIELDDPLGISDNLVVRAARMAMDTMRASGRVEVRLRKRIPMGAGLGGGSSDAAAVLLALPALAGRTLDLAKLSGIAASLGSDVPFFLLGGAAVGIGRGTEIFPLPDRPAMAGVVVAPEVHVSTAQAYRDLSSGLTSEAQENKIFSFQSVSWERGVGKSSENDFEAVVFQQHRNLVSLRKRLVRAGATAAMMTGSGSALFGLFPDRHGISAAMQSLGDERVFRISLVSRARYRQIWWRALGSHAVRDTWPPQSRYAQ